MLVILRENVENLGRTGDVVRVSDGYARNFLIPRNMVALADEKNVANIEHQKKLLEKKRLVEREKAKEIAQKLNSLTVTITRKVGDQDKLFGSVSVSDIHEAIKAAGHSVDKRMVVLENPIKALGTHGVKVRLDSDINATVKVAVVKE